MVEEEVVEEEAVEEEVKETGDWQEIKGGDIFTFDEPGTELEGQLVEVRKEQGKYRSMVYDIKRGDGSLVAIFGSTVLDSRMSQIQKGDFVRIKFKGTIKSKKSGREYADFQVFVKGPENENVFGLWERTVRSTNPLH